MKKKITVLFEQPGRRFRWWSQCNKLCLKAIIGPTPKSKKINDFHLSDPLSANWRRTSEIHW